MGDRRVLRTDDLPSNAARADSSSGLRKDIEFTRKETERDW